MKKLKRNSEYTGDLSQMICEINELLNLSFDHLQPFELIRDSWPVNEKRVIEGTICTKLANSDDHMQFLTEIPPGTGFNLHWHDCLEICRVITGRLADKVIDPTREWKAGQKYTVEKMRRAQTLQSRP